MFRIVSVRFPVLKPFQISAQHLSCESLVASQQLMPWQVHLFLDRGVGWNKHSTARQGATCPRCASLQCAR